MELVQRRALKAVHNTEEGCLDDLLRLQNGVSFHKMHIIYLVEIFKTLNGLNPSFMSRIFPSKDVSLTHTIDLAQRL